MTAQNTPSSPPSVQPEPAFQAGRVLILASGHFIHDVFSSFLVPLLPLIIDKFGLSLTLAGLLPALYRFPSVFNPFIGVLADRMDLRILVILAPTLTATAMSLIGVAPSYAVIAILLLVAGASSAALHVPGPVMVARVSGVRVGKGMSFWMTGGELARTVGPLLAVSAASLWELEGMYPVMVVGMAASALLYWRLKDAPFVPRAVRPRGFSGQMWRALGRMLVPITGILLCKNFMSAALTTFLPTFLSSEGKSLWFGGAALAVLEFSGAVGALAAGTLSDRLGRRTVLFIALVVSPLLVLGLLAADGWILFPILVALGFTILSPTPVVMAIIQDRASDNPATANGLYMAISFLISSGMGVLTGRLADVLGLRAAFTWSAAVAFLGIPIIFLLPRK
ncbi:MAG: MFS transporter [Anaerolineae bacterium]|nr:MFS transporter [Anaerolineae bacterium]